MSNKKYNIYFKNKCIYESLPDDEFQSTWKMIHNFLSITGNVEKEDLFYREIRTN